MSVDPACPASLPASEALDDQDSSLMPVVPEPEGKHPTLQLPCAQVPLTDTGKENAMPNYEPFLRGEREGKEIMGHLEQ